MNNPLVPRLGRRVPGWTEILPVYGVIVLVLYTWTIVWFFWKLPGWLYYLTAGEMLTALAHSLLTSFVESLLVLCGPLALCLLLPRRWFRDLFVARAASLTMAGLGYMMYLGFQFTTKDDVPAIFLPPWSVPAALALMALIVFLAGNIPAARRVIESFADRATIFVYILLPATLLAMILVLVRWIS
jgi:hypothetical protein